MRPGTLPGAIAKLMTACIMASGLAACGFQLRGAPPVSSAIEPLQLVCQPPVPASLCQSTREQLALGGVQLAGEETASYVLRIRDFEQDRRASAITVQAAAAEYTLRQSVNMELAGADGVPVIASTRITTSESYRYDETNVLAKQREEDSLQQQLSNRLAQQIIFRLAPITTTRLQEIRDNHQTSGRPTSNQTSKP